MQYKGWLIEPVYGLCADWKLNQHGAVVKKKPKPKDISYYQILDPLNNNARWCPGITIQECKDIIDAFHKRMGWKKNQ